MCRIEFLSLSLKKTKVERLTELWIKQNGCMNKAGGYCDDCPISAISDDDYELGICKDRDYSKWVFKCPITLIINTVF